MANEWELVGGDPTVVDFTVASGTAIEQGSVLALTDPRTGAQATISGAIIAGVAATEKSITDGDLSVELGCWVGGGARFLVTASGAVAVGAPIIHSGTNNLVAQAQTAGNTRQSGAQLIGYALEAIADNTTGEIVLSVGGS